MDGNNMKEKICGKVYVETWKSDMDGKPRERDVRCTLPPGHVPGHGWELDKVALSQPVTAKANMLTRSLRAEILEGDTQRAIDTLDSLCDVLAKALP
jgi:hypothetical protein